MAPSRRGMSLLERLLDCTWLRRASALIAVPMVALMLASPVHARELTVYAAASLQNAMEEIARRFQQKTGRIVKFSFASSGALARQIEQGAPAGIFASADEQWMDHLAQAGVLAADTRAPLLGNRLVLITPAASRVTVDLKPGFDFMKLLGADGRWTTGDPASVPVGRYAQQALTHLGAWDAAQARLVKTGNVRVALAFVERGEAVAGIVYATDAAVSTKVRIAGIFPGNSHTTITYPFAIIERHNTPAAREFLAFLSGGEATAVWTKHGFSVL